MAHYFQSLWLCVLILILFQNQHRVRGACPDQDTSLKRWSSHATWPNGEKPRLNDAVNIDSAVLLDESPPELDHITIQPNGRLVWSQEGDYNLTLKHILIYGSMEIGSEDCPFKRKTHILLRGMRGQYSIEFNSHLFGEKFIGVAPGGTLEIHGEKKLSWTKLTKTLPKLTQSNGLVFNHMDSPSSRVDYGKAGIVVYVFDHRDANVMSSKFFDIGDYPSLSRSESSRLTRHIHDLPRDEIIALAVNKYLRNPALYLKSVFHALRGLGFKLDYVITHGAAFVFIAQRGHPQNAKQALSSYDHTDFRHATATLTVGRYRYIVESIVDNENSFNSRVDFRVADVAASHPILNVLDDVSTWIPGDQVVLASTDYDWEQAEVATVVPCATCTAFQVQVELDTHYTHFGEMTYNVDQRGEVALLTRNIKIEGEMEDECQTSNGNCDRFLYDTFGGHIKFVKGFKSGHLEGLELYHMGQQTEKGFYPVHFHMCHDVDEVGNYSHPPYFRDSSVHHSFSRCVTVHGTSGVTVQDNVCYDNLGHAYFLEDGGEKRNTFDGNIGLSTKKGWILISDRRPATFWMTNPINRLTNNVAAGSEMFGIWYVYPDEPYGPSIGLGFMQKYEAMRTPILEFDNNVAHSNANTGLYAENRLLETSEAAGSNEYSPRMYPLDPNSPPASVNFTRPTLYKNRRRNMHLRGGWLRIDRGSFADSAIGVVFAKSDDQQQFLYNSVFLGESKNIGEPDTLDGMSRSLPIPGDIHTPIEGFAFYEGPVYVENSWFSHFVNQQLYPEGALGFRRNDSRITSSAVSAVKGLKFGFNDVTNGNRVYYGNSSIPEFADDDGAAAATVRDIDGSLTGNVGSQLVRSSPFNMNAGCYVRTNWNMAVCPQLYGKLTVRLLSTEDGGQTSPFAVRDDIPTVRETTNLMDSAQFLTILGGDYSYTIHWSNYVPRQFTISGDGIEDGKWVRFGVCLPRDAHIQVISYSPKFLGSTNDWYFTKNLAELEADTVGDKCFWDPSVGLLFFKFMNENTRTPNDTKECPGGSCPNIKITVLSGNTMDADCTLRAYNGAYNRKAPVENKVLKHIDLSATLSAPTSSMGAGETRPFAARRAIDGQFGSWTDWSTCANYCSGETQYRYRACNQPTAKNGGKLCVGNAVESRSCGTHECSTDGGRTAAYRRPRYRQGVQTRRRDMRRN